MTKLAFLSGVWGRGLWLFGRAGAMSVRFTNRWYTLLMVCFSAPATTNFILLVHAGVF